MSPSRFRRVTLRSLASLVMLLGGMEIKSPAQSGPTPADEGLSLSWADEMLTVRGRDIPGGALKIW